MLDLFFFGHNENAIPNTPNPNLATTFFKLILCYKDNNKKQEKIKQEDDFFLASTTSNGSTTSLIRVSFGPRLAIVVGRTSPRAWNVVGPQRLVTYVT